MYGSKMELEAAQALLDLHNNARQFVPTNSRAESQVDHSDDVIKTAKLYMNCFFTSNVDPSTSFGEISGSRHVNQINNVNEIPTGYPTNNTSLIEQNSNNQCNIEEETTAMNNDAITQKESDCRFIRSLELMLNINLHKQFEDSQVISNTNDVSTKLNEEKSNISTRDYGTQTTENSHWYKIQIMEFTIEHLSDRIKSLEAQSSPAKVKSGVLKEENRQKDEENHCSDEASPRRINCNKYNLTEARTSNNKPLTTDVCENEGRKKGNSSDKVINRNQLNDLVPIGKGRALVSARLLRHINWNSYTSATRKLLTAIFSRRVLATHSLTGKRSPAFPKKQPKKKLNVDLVQDIVQTVVDRCRVPENVVRTSITTKCADESKMYRTRMLNRKIKKKKIIENISPETTDSDDGSLN